MAGADSRRSTRARTNLPHSQSNHSSTNSNASSSGRASHPERSTRAGANHRSGSPTQNKGGSSSSSGDSLSSEPPDDVFAAASSEEPSSHAGGSSVAGGGGPSRRRAARGGGGGDRERSLRLDSVEMGAGHGGGGAANAVDDIQEEDEAVRCVCGFDDYPGPPPVNSTDADDPNTAFLLAVAAADVNEDLAGFFVQCDVCKVWQHGACVGMMPDQTGPDEYFCEQCRKDLHKIYKAKNGQRYSLYLPLSRPSRTTSATSRAGSLAKDSLRSPKALSKELTGRVSSAIQTSKRRSTMNSRDAAYDEEEELRRAIEASKEEATSEPPEAVNKRAKRGRSDSEEKLDNVKRQRTASRSPTPVRRADSESNDDSEEPLNSRSAKRARLAAASKNSKEKPAGDEKDRQRNDSNSKRKGRADRRRVDVDSDPSDELPLAITRTAARNNNAETARKPPDPKPPPQAQTTTTSQSVPDTPPGAKERPIVTSSKKASASNSKATSTSANNTSHKKKGRNQYTKDRDNESPAPARSTSRDIHGADNDLRFNPHNTRSGNAADSAPAQPPTASGGGGRTAGGNRPRSGRADKGHGDDNSSGQGHGHGHGKAGGIPARINIQDMKRRASAILEFIQRTQLELANEEPVPGIVSKLHARSTTTVARTLPGPNAGGSEEPISPVVAAPGMPQITVNGEANGATSASNGKADDNGAVDPPADTREFKELSCLEMMDAITRSLVKWQNRFESL